MKRFSQKAFPPYQFLPGKALHPEKEGGYLFGTHLTFSPLGESFFENVDFLYSLDLISHSFFWEGHVYLEGLWNQVRKTKKNEAAFLQSLIIFCAAGVKALIDSPEASRAHFLRSLELMKSVKELKEFDLMAIIFWMENFDFKQPTSFPADSPEI